MNSNQSNLLNQALHAPIENLDLLDSHIALVRSSSSWSDVAILIDEGIKACLVLLLCKDRVVSILRICMHIDDSVAAIDMLTGTNDRALFGSYQGKVLTQTDIHSLEKINDIWNAIPDQITEFSLRDVKKFFKRIEKNSMKTGRGRAFSIDTRRKVIQDSHGYCMYEGCGQNLCIEDLTGKEGNFSYLAHNIASSEQGARGVKELSGKLSDDPNNILLLCDKHHRLIDKVAAADYPAQRISQMRREFCVTANKLLEGLGYQPIPAYAVLWPVHRQVVAAPSQSQIAQSLAPIHCRLSSQLNDLSDNEHILREEDPDIANKVLIHSISSIAEKILDQTHSSRYQAGLFAFGLMPHLIALGAKLGNKAKITPMLRYRDSGLWTWPLEAPRREFYTISGIEELSQDESDVCLTLALTNEPESLATARELFAGMFGAKQVIVKALPGFIGNGALGHPDDGYSFVSQMQALLHELKGKHGTKRIHLFPCASNAACIFFGQAFDSHHPDILIYDFFEESMKPSLALRNIDNKCKIELPD